MLIFDIIYDWFTYPKKLREHKYTDRRSYLSSKPWHTLNKQEQNELMEFYEINGYY